MTNLATLPADIRMSIEAQRIASLWICRVADGTWTHEKVKLEISAIADEAFREEVRRWCRHFNAIRKIKANQEPSPRKVKTARPASSRWRR
ncbi:hypothetical protein [Aeromonas veronii]|uniref:hypothetical protein n=1 Tax=Aeromonas veronii TaxID=654 RepID=UPI0022454F5D|nr:hypothetical protein [Aeromonas veronii]MCX0428871.1 hypothetical protein [Aeromonas veronii]MCX0448380.1 hypothetical protein [Aeromonas veronii]